MLGGAIAFGIFGIITLMGVSVSLSDDDPNPGQAGATIFLFILGVGCLFLSHWIIMDKGYKNGQIDAISGTFKYEPVYHYINKDTIPHDTTYIWIENE